MDLVKLTAKIERYTYNNKENGYSIIRVKTKDNEDATIVGYIPILNEDVFYVFLGSWTTHDTYGKQFSVTSYTKSGDQTVEGIISYLSSSFFTGIGPVTATNIVEELGIDAVQIIIDDKDVLDKFKFSKLKKERLHQQLIENTINEDILTTLYSYNISTKIAMKILNTYGSKAIEKINKDPYMLANDIDGIGFIKADEIATKMGIEENDPRRITAAILFAMQTFTNQRGDIYLKIDLLESTVFRMLKFEFDVNPYLDKLILNNKIILEEDRYYLKDIYLAEITVAKELQRLMTKPSNITNYNYLEQLFDMVQVQKQIEYTELQKDAILNSLKSKISVITGGPGTGKTTIIDGIISVYAAYFKLDLRKDTTEDIIALMAPTGRAAKRMEEVLDLTAKTIHRQLGIGFDGINHFDAEKKLRQKLVIIDESSMIDIYLAKRLFETIDDDAQIIIVGDVDQLPSVGPGAVLKDIIESNSISVVRLDEIHRQAKDSNIIKLANKVNMQILDIESLESGNDLFLYRTQNELIKDLIVNQIKGAVNQGYDLVDDIQVLIPMYKGELGIDSVNKLLQENFNDTSKPFIEHRFNKFYEKDKVIQLVNDPNNKIMNGDIGVIKTISKTTNNKDYLVVSFDGHEVKYEKSDLDVLSLAYAMSIHKSQGSEYKIVILPLIRQYTHMLKKELLYTAITRAKDYLIVLGSMELLVYAANNLSEQRNTSLKYRLEDIIKDNNH